MTITVDAASAGGQAQLKGHAGHTGPIFDPATMTNGGGWGDIIPPWSYVVEHGPDAGTTVTFDGLNWTDEGQAILDNGCALPDQEEPEPEPSPSPEPPGDEGGGGDVGGGGGHHPKPDDQGPARDLAFTGPTEDVIRLGGIALSMLGASLMLFGLARRPQAI